MPHLFPFVFCLCLSQPIASNEVKHSFHSRLHIQIENLSNPSPDRWYSFYHYSHPPLTERLAAICARQEGREKKRG
jgi:Zn-dependent protease with chaperone function